MSKDDFKSREQARLAYEWKTNGKTNREISNLLKVHVTRVSDLLRNHQRDIDHPPPDFEHELSRRAFIALYSYGNPWKDTKEQLIEAIRNAKTSANHEHPNSEVVLSCGKITEAELMKWAGATNQVLKRLPSLKKLLRAIRKKP